MEHTKLPWKTGDRHPCRIMAAAPTGSMGSEVVGFTCLLDNFGTETEREKANAEFIVRACNSHDALFEACKNVLDLLDKCAITTREGEAVNALLYTRELRAAIAKAEGAAPTWGRVR